MQADQHNGVRCTWLGMLNLDVHAEDSAVDLNLCRSSARAIRGSRDEPEIQVLLFLMWALVFALVALFGLVLFLSVGRARGSGC